MLLDFREGWNGAARGLSVNALDFFGSICISCKAIVLEEIISVFDDRKLNVMVLDVSGFKRWNEHVSGFLGSLNISFETISSAVTELVGNISVNVASELKVAFRSKTFTTMVSDDVVSEDVVSIEMASDVVDSKDIVGEDIISDNSSSVDILSDMDPSEGVSREDTSVITSESITS
jgi:hypothetical protein